MRVPHEPQFAQHLLHWFDQHGRHDLPWQNPRTPYRVWLSEVMLQQTQVATVVAYFLRFVNKFPDLQALAAASQDDVLSLWSGLGYYTRARNLHRAAQICVERYSGDLPRDIAQLCALPGVGRSTAGAIMAQAYGERHAILDGNVKRVLARYHGQRGWPGATQAQRQLWTNAELHTPTPRVADYTQAIMDLGATVCTRSRPKCATCPLAADCIARRDGLTDILPERKVRRALPTRQTVMLVLRDGNGRLLLQRRPPVGVWAQMWSLPEAADAAAACTSVARDHGLGHADIVFRPLPAFVHTFTHYRLDVTPLALDIAAPLRMHDDPDRRWLHPADCAKLGLPAPVRKLINRIAEEA
jgi:A/G-specific adenine glycosylase